VLSPAPARQRHRAGNPPRALPACHRRRANPHRPSRAPNRHCPSGDRRRSPACTAYLRCKLRAL